MSTLPHADGGPGSVFSILEVMRVAQLASRALSRNLSMTLPPDYTPLTLAEVFYMATMGGARGTMLITQANLWPGFLEGRFEAHSSHNCRSRVWEGVSHAIYHVHVLFNTAACTCLG